MSTAQGNVMTVLGPVAAAGLGVTLTHEHCLIDLRGYCSIPAEVALRAMVEAPLTTATIGLSRRNPLLQKANLLLDSIDESARELLEFKKLGGNTIVDLTLPDIGRDPNALAILARMTGLNIVMGCGHYIHIVHPASIEQESAESIGERLLKELQEGVGETGVMPGIIGEIGTVTPIHPNEEKVLRGAAIAHKARGVPIAVHISPATHVDGWMGHKVLDILEAEGVNPNRVLLCHQDNMLEPDVEFAKALGHHRDLAKRGCYIGYDGCGKDHYFPSTSRAAYPSFWCPSDRERAKATARMLEFGLGEHLLISHDVCFKIEWTQYGGFGYGHILRTFTNNLKDYGVGNKELEMLLKHNAQRFLAPSI